MIHAAIYGKLDCLGSEDALTAAVFTRLRYLPPQVVGEWFALARNHVNTSAQAMSLASEPIIEFWPRVQDTLRGHGAVEPDVIVRFDDEVIVVEAKLWSPKSQTDEGHDQLARQWKSTTDHYVTRARVSALIYLTPHVEPPREALEESAQALGPAAANLWWLSWSSLAPILERLVEGSDRVSRVVASDLLAYLGRVGVLRFRGWRLAADWHRQACWTYGRDRDVGYWSGYSMSQPVWRYT